MYETGFVLSYAITMTISTLAWVTGRISVVLHNGLMAAVNALCTLVSVYLDWTLTSFMAAASTAMYGWLWWKGGGGDGTRRRLRSWARRFQGVRRTAPQGA